MELPEVELEQITSISVPEMPKPPDGTKNGGLTYCKEILSKARSVLDKLLLTTEELNDEEVRDLKRISIISGIILGANYSTITSLPGMAETTDGGVHQIVLIQSALSFMLSLFLTVAPVAVPNLNLRRAKNLVALAGIFTASSYSAYVALKLGPVSRGTVIAMLFMGICVLLICVASRTVKANPPPTSRGGADMV